MPPMERTREGRGTPIANLVSRVQARLIRLTGGRLFGTFYGAPVGVLTTTGRRSGQSRVASLIYGHDGDALVLIASNGGHPEDPPWYRNLVADPDVAFRIGTEQRSYRAETVPDGAERARLWGMMNDVYPGYDHYQADTERVIPVVRLHPLEP